MNDELPGPVRFESIAGERNRARFYILGLQRTLWGELALVCTWGRIGGPGRTLVRVVSSSAVATTALERAVERRIKRGYRPRTTAISPVSTMRRI